MNRGPQHDSPDSDSGVPAIERILAIDYGRARHGLALSDPLGITAQPLPAVAARNAAKALDEIAALCEDRGVTLVVVGLPLKMDGTEGPAAAEVRRYAEQVKARLALPVEMWDERLTTAQAERAMLDHDLSRAKRKVHRDAMAAQILLQTWLDAHRSAR